MKAHFVKRFVIETSTLGKKFSFISHERGSKLILITSNQAPVLSFNYRTKTGEKKNRLEAIEEFVTVKGWKAMGNKLGQYLRISGFKWLEKNQNHEKKDGDISLTLFDKET